MSCSLSERAVNFVHAFMIEQTVLLVYWMLVVELDTGRIDSLHFVLWGIAFSTAVLFIIKLVFDVLFLTLEAAQRQQKQSMKWTVLLVFLFDSAGASYCGWTLFSVVTGTSISSRTMIIICFMTSLGMISLNLMFEYILGYLPSAVVLQIVKLKSSLMNHYDDIDL